MKSTWFSFIFAVLILTSCQNNDAARLAELKKDAQKRDLIFKTISKGWRFQMPPLNAKTQALTQDWPELHAFAAELNQTPKSTTNAFQKKAVELSKKAFALNNNIPIPFNRPEIKSRVAALNTKVNSLTLFLNIDDIPQEKIVLLVQEINIALQSLYQQLDEVVRRNDIPKEEGETDMIRMLDTARAIPNQMPPNSLQKH